MMDDKIDYSLVQELSEEYKRRSSHHTLREVIKALCGHDVIPFDENNKDDLELLEDLKQAAQCAVDEIQKKKILEKRANEVGNRIEKFVQDALKLLGYDAHVPTTSSGKNKSVGYPDIVFYDKAHRLTYVECKTYNHANIDTTQRSFYLSPSSDFKVTGDAHHFVVSLEIVELSRDTNTGQNVYTASGWKILDIADLPLDLKIEFNSDNRRLYGGEQKLILAEHSTQK
ncbi:MAG TPA: hypothetical protein O0X34_02300 [Methanocorpusculum sp.]|nr:hypothetical protein [Methanocorpusculum sp.]HJK41056.1 hypothetical protein [Methanocorpusculum sp.]HJK47057.1 hypothetical protein [Methanocorpusculum sp.]HJK65108.1 hypothetical protein [Methanocorpusculum sp.]HJK69301.1 hypothetical protein [Methanocorpusculum sp.]